MREKIALPPTMHDDLLNNLVGLTTVKEAILLSTCNRTEIYCDTNEPEQIIPWLAQQHQLSPELLVPYFYIHQGHHAIRHTLRVASGLDSMMLGEPQIFGQMKQAYHYACQLGTIKTNLRQAFQYIFSASKRIRNLSGIGSGPVSVAYAAVQLVSQLFDDFKDLKVFIIGSGETAKLVAKYLHKQGASDYFVASRTRENAESLAANFNGKALTISDIPQYLPQADVIISATACPLPFINKNLVEHALSQRGNAPMIFLDLAMPRDIEPEVANLDQVSLYNIDDLQSLSEKGMDERRSAALQAEQLIEFELDNYIRWHRSLRAKDVICDYRSHMQSLAQEELDRAQKKIEAGSCQTRVMQEFSERLINKLTHWPTVGFRQAAEDGREEFFDLVHYLFSSKTPSILE